MNSKNEIRITINNSSKYKEQQSKFYQKIRKESEWKLKDTTSILEDKEKSRKEKKRQKERTDTIKVGVKLRVKRSELRQMHDCVISIG